MDSKSMILVSFENNASFVNCAGCGLVAEVIKRLKLDEQLELPFGKVSLHHPELPNSEIKPTMTVENLFDIYKSHDEVPFIVKCTKRLRQNLESDTVDMSRSATTGFPGFLITRREITVNRFLELLYPKDCPNASPRAIFFKSPPFSGKTGIARLIFQKLLEDDSIKSVVYLSGDPFMENISVDQLFMNTHAISLDTFLSSEDKRVLIFDEAQASYTDKKFWQLMQRAIDHDAFPGLKLVFFICYGSFMNFGKDKADAPVTFPPQFTFGLNTNPGLALTRDEFEEMIRGEKLSKYSDLIFSACSRHIGIGNTVINFLSKMFRSQPDLNEAKVKLALFSETLLMVVKGNRGMPEMQSLEKLIASYPERLDISDLSLLKHILDTVARLQQVDSQEFSNASDPKLCLLFALLLKYGFLFMDEEGYVKFASDMHMKVWLYTCRADPIESICFLNVKDILVFALERMSASRLCAIGATSKGLLSERQFQMELYQGLVSILPKSTYIIPEFRTFDSKKRLGFVDLVIQFGGDFLFLELLRDGDAAAEHEARFQKDGKYYEAISPASKYGLIDYRTRKQPSKIRPGFLYIWFTENFTTATVLFEGEQQQVSLK
jgi:hypothetical protein